MAYVYSYSLNGVVKYIGKGNGSRDIEHLRKTKNKRFAAWLSTVTPTVERIADSLTEEEAFALEQQLISKYGRLGYEEGGTLLNHAEGGRGGTLGVKLSEETRQRMRAERISRRGEQWSATTSRVAKESWADPITREKRTASLRIAAKNPSTLAKRNKPCTIDGSTIFESRKELIKVLGQGKMGSNHPNFKYVDPNSIVGDSSSNA